MGKVEAVLDEDKRQLRERFSTSEIHLVCPWHGWEFDVRTGQSWCDPDNTYVRQRSRAVLQSIGASPEMY